MLSNMMIIILNVSCVEFIGELRYFCGCKPSASSSRKVGMPYLFWVLRESSLSIYHSLCPNLLSCFNGDGVGVFVQTAVYIVVIRRQQCRCTPIVSISWSYCVEPYVIIILYTGTGSVIRFDACAGAKRRGLKLVANENMPQQALTSFRS